MKTLVMVLAFLSLSLSGCSSFSDWLRSRASFDLDCPREQLTIATLGPWSVKGVSGCGKKAVYVLINDQWLLNTEGQHEILQASLLEEQRRIEQKRREEEEERREWEQFEKRMKSTREDNPQDSLLGM